AQQRPAKTSRRTVGTSLRDVFVQRLCVTSLVVLPLSAQQLPVRQVVSGVYVVLGDSGRGSEGRPNAGFIVTGDGVVVIDALASPAQGEQLVRTIRSVTREPLRWVVLTPDTLRLGAKTIVIAHAWRGAAHTAGDLIVWLPAERVLFAGDLLIEDGVTMVVDGSGKGLLEALDTLRALAPRIAVPGHGAIPADPRVLIDRTRDYMLR